MVQVANIASRPVAPGLLRSWLGNRVALAVAGVAVAVAGLGLGWNWLTAIGVAPLILSVGPCLVMCALGMCMMGKSHQSASRPQTPQSAEPTAPLRSSTEC